MSRITSKPRKTSKSRATPKSRAVSKPRADPKARANSKAPALRSKAIKPPAPANVLRAPASAEAQPKRQNDMADAAAQVFAAKGFHGASTQDIADVLGIRQASLYYYFKSKDDALRIVCEKGAAGFHERAKKIVEAPGASREKLATLITAHLAPLEDRADYVRVFLRERQHLSPAARKTIDAHARRVETCFETVIAQGMSYGAFSPRHDPRLATLAILAMVNAVPFWKDTSRRNARGKLAASAAREIAQMALGGLTGVAWYDTTANTNK